MAVVEMGNQFVKGIKHIQVSTRIKISGCQRSGRVLEKQQTSLAILVVFAYFFRNKVSDVDDLFGFCGRDCKLHRDIIAGSCNQANWPWGLIGGQAVINLAPCHILHYNVSGSLPLCTIYYFLLIC